MAKKDKQTKKEAVVIKRWIWVIIAIFLSMGIFFNMERIRGVWYDTFFPVNEEEVLPEVVVVSDEIPSVEVDHIESPIIVEEAVPPDDYIEPPVIPEPVLETKPLPESKPPFTYKDTACDFIVPVITDEIERAAKKYNCNYQEISYLKKKNALVCYELSGECYQFTY